MKKILISSLYILFGSLAFGQGGSDVVTIVGLGNRQVEPAYRMTENPKIIDTTIASPVSEYPLLFLQYSTSIELDKISPATIKTEPKLLQLYQTYVKLGVGTELMPLGEIYFDSKRDRKFLYGAHAQHLSSFGNFENYAPAQFDRTKVGLYGALNEKRYSLRSNVHYNNQGLHYYGWKIPTDSVNRDETAQRFQDVGGSFNFASHKKDSATLNYTIGMEYSNYTSKKPLLDSLSDWRASENYFALKTSGFYKYGKEIFAADFNVRYNGYKYGVESDTNSFALDSGIVRNNTLINLKPTISTFSKDNRFKAKIGVDIVVDANTTTKAHIYPVAELKYSLFNDIFIPYLGLRGGLKQVTFKTLTQENEFLLTNVMLRNESTAIDAYFGFIDSEGEAFRLLFESDMSVEHQVRERLNRMTYDSAAALSAVISLDTGLTKEASMMLAVGLIGTAQTSARHWLERDGKLDRETAVELVSNLIWRGISGFPKAN